MSYDKYEKKLAEVARYLTVYDFSPAAMVEIVHDDGSRMTFTHAIARQWEGFLLVWTEHNDHHYFSLDDCYYRVWQRQHESFTLEDNSPYTPLDKHQREGLSKYVDEEFIEQRSIIGRQNK